MILLTVGTQLPFDRFVRIVDEIAPTLPTPVFAQTGAGHYEPSDMEWRRIIPPIEFEDLLRRCSLIVSHAGIGTFVMAQRYLKPLILFPRLASLDEHRNDHQLATVRALQGRPGVHVAHDADALAALLRRPLEPPAAEEANPERDRLRVTIAQFVGGALDRGR